MTDFRAHLSAFVSRSVEGRDYVLDATRGLAMMGMILVNFAPPTEAIYSPIAHARWHGWTLADTIFPLFLFVVGVSLTLALKAPARPDAGELHWKIVRRALLLFAVGAVLINFPYYSLHDFKPTSVLGHIAVCYLIAAVLYVHTSWRTQLALIPILWMVDWALLRFVDVPGFGAGVLTPEGNAVKYVDQWLLGAHSVAAGGENDPDGLLVMFSAVSTTLIGVLAGTWLKSKRDLPTRIAGLLAAGFAMIALGSAWDSVLPVNKSLWTPSYVAFMAGISLQLLGAGYWVVEVCGFRSWARPLQVAGVNALAFYVFASVVQRVLVYGRIGVDGATMRLRPYIYEHLILPWAPGKPGALLYASIFLLLCFGFTVWLYRRKIFFKL